MYAAGLTVREIARWCHANVAAIHLHLQVRERYTPGVHEAHAAALAQRDPDRASTRWRKRLAEVQTFQEAHGRLPDGRAVEESSLARWVALQRNAYLQGHMSATKIILLDGLKGWQLDVPRQRRDEHWRTLLASVKEFVASTGQMPRYKTFESEDERVLV